MITTGFAPVARPVVKAPAIKFQADSQPSAAEKELSRKLDALSQAIARGQAQLVAKQADGNFTVRINGELYNVSGLGRPRYGTMPVQYSLEKLVTGEALEYTGPGCFGLSSVAYKASVGEEPERIYSDVVYKVAKVFSDLGKLAGIGNQSEG
jgi:hypothetical protein